MIISDLDYEKDIATNDVAGGAVTLLIASTGLRFQSDAVNIPIGPVVIAIPSFSFRIPFGTTPPAPPPAP
jgi:hypothetical protein